jgi:hypothetical protein
MQAENVNILCNFGVTEPRRYEAQILPFPNALAAVIGRGGERSSTPTDYMNFKISGMTFEKVPLDIAE